MKTLIASLLILAVSSEFAPKPSIEVQFLKGESKPLGVILRSGVMEFTEKDGKKAYWVTGKALEEINHQIETYKE